LVLSSALQFVKDNFDQYSIDELLQKATDMIGSSGGVDLDYFTIANGETLLPEEDKSAVPLVALVAAKVGDTRLIDNMILN